MYSVTCNVLTQEKKLTKYPPISFRRSRRTCEICLEKQAECADHVRVLRLPVYSLACNPFFKNFIRRIRSGLCRTCLTVNDSFSRLRQKTTRIFCPKCRRHIVRPLLARQLPVATQTRQTPATVQSQTHQTAVLSQTRQTLITASQTPVGQSPSPLKRRKKKPTKKRVDVLTLAEHKLQVTDPRGKSVGLKDLCFGDALLVPPFLKTIPRNYFYRIHKLYGYFLRKNHAFGTVYSRVTKRESWLKKYILSKRIKYGSRCVISPSPDFRNVLRVWIPRAVASNRNVKDGDVVLIHRFPTLTAEHFVYARARIWDNLTLGVSVAVLPAMRSDCDGDVGDVLCVNGLEEKAEAEILMNPENSFLTPSSNRNVLCFTQHMCYVFRLEENLALLSDRLPVYFRCDSFTFRGGERESIKETDRESIKMTEKECIKVTDREGIKVSDREGIKMTKREDIKMTEKEGMKETDIESIKLTEGKGIKVTGRVTRSQLNEFLRHVYYQLGAKAAVECFDAASELTHTRLKKEIRGVTLSDVKELTDGADVGGSPQENEDNLFLVQCRNEIKGSEEKIKKHLVGRTQDNYFCGIPEDHQYHNAKVGRAGLVDSITLISKTGYDFKKIIFSLHDVVISYRGDVTMGKGESLVHDLEFLFEYVHSCTGMKKSLLYALKYYRDKCSRNCL